MQRLRNLLKTDDDQLSDFAIIAALIAIVLIVAFLFLTGETSPVYHGVGRSV
jgi:hypothetical protein